MATKKKTVSGSRLLKLRHLRSERERNTLDQENRRLNEELTEIKNMSLFQLLKWKLFRNA